MINKRYVLFTRIDLVKSQSGKIFCDPLWAKDLKLHLDYITDFRICCPLIYDNDVQGLEDITDYPIQHIFELTKDYGFASVTKNIIPNFFRVMEACKKADIVHSGGAGWAFPLSFYLLLLRPFFSFQWVMLIESSFWMLGKDEKQNPRKILEHYLYKIILSCCFKQADARIFTQSFYRQFFLKEETKRTLIAPAIWLDKDIIVSPEMVKQRLLHRTGKTLEMIFPARLIEDKGVLILFDAIKFLKNLDVSVNITIMGSGKLEKDCRQFVMGDFGSVTVQYYEPIKYGIEFFNFLRNYDLVLVPNLKEEQPRIIFDAFSQGLGVIASDTSGILDITRDGENAVICQKGNPQSLAQAISYVVENPDLALRMGLNGLDYVSGKSHLQMHLDRQSFLVEVLDIE